MRRCVLSSRTSLLPRSLQRCASVLSQSPAAAASANEAQVVQLLLQAGLSRGDVSLACQRDESLLSYDALNEVAPRLAYLAYLRDVAPTRWGWPGATSPTGALEGVASFVTRQPFVLERSFGVVHACPDFLAICKPWDTRHDVPRGWGAGAPRFTAKHAGDDWSAEEFVGCQRPHWDKVRFAHQIDFATSGVLLACASKSAAARASECFKQRRARKRYRAVLLGSPARDCWTVDAAVSYDEADSQGFRMRLAPEHQEGAKEAKTRFTVLRRGLCALVGPWYGAEVTYVECAPESGRRHQIRVHALHSGLPVLGDCTYSPDRDSFRMFLHGITLELPMAGEQTLRVRAEVPRSFQAAMQGGLDIEV